jgi:hypothetical protein
VFEALKSITTLVLSDLRRRGVWRAEAPVASAVTGATPLPAAPAGAEPPATSFDQREDSGITAARSPNTDGSISASLQQLAERAPDEPPPAVDLKPLEPEGPVDGGQLARGAALSEILPPGAARDAVVAVEYFIHRGDYAGAVNQAAKVFNDAAQHAPNAASSGNEGPVLHALMLGIAGSRYLRFRETAARAAAGGASSADALFALFFVVDVALRSLPAGALL